jgi:RNA polymerase sigma-70 factor, ECF subfamily
MEPARVPIEAVETGSARRALAADAVVTLAWAEHHEALFSFLVRTTRDMEAAEELLQEAYLRLTRELLAGRAPDNVRAWLFQVAANLAVSRGRRLSTALRGLVRLRPVSAAGPDTSPEQIALAREGRCQLLHALDGLKPDARAALLLASEGFTGAEIGAAIGRSEAAARTLLCRTRLQARQLLEAEEAVR